MKKNDESKKILEFIEELKLFYPIIKYEEINNFEKAKYYVEEFDLLVRSKQFKDVLLLLSSILPKKILTKDFKSRCKSMDLNNTFQELLAGNILFNKHYSIGYNPKILGKTPDWMISNKNNKAIIEVFTLNKYETLIEEKSQLVLLYSKLQQLQYPFGIVLNLSRMNQDLSQMCNIDNAIEEVNNHIQNNPTNNIPTLTLCCGIDLSFLYQKENERISICGDSKMLRGSAHSYRLINAIDVKYYKYKDIIRNSKIPFIICCVVNGYNRMNTASFNEMIFGNHQVNGVLSNKKGKEISGFLLIKNNYYYDNYEIEYIENPNANYKFAL